MIFQVSNVVFGLKNLESNFGIVDRLYSDMSDEIKMHKFKKIILKNS